MNVRIKPHLRIKGTNNENQIVKNQQKLLSKRMKSALLKGGERDF